MGRPFHPLTSEGFVWRDPAQAQETLTRYRTAGRELLHFVWDWDGTIAPEPGSTWHIMRDALPPDAQTEHRRLYAHYSALQTAGQLDSALEREWSARALTLHVVNRTLISAIHRQAARVIVRQGATEAFRVCEEAEVPTVVLSAGVKDVIEAVAEDHDIHPTTILATQLAREKRRVVGWHPDTMIDSSTKREMGHPDLSLLRDLRPNAVLYGDQEHDARMFDGDGLRIRVDGEHTVGSVEWGEYLEQSWAAGYDGVTVHDDLLAVVSLNRWLIGSGQSSGPSIPQQPIYDSRFSSQRPV